jgi:hypothetical protein
MVTSSPSNVIPYPPLPLCYDRQGPLLKASSRKDLSHLFVEIWYEICIAEGEGIFIYTYIYSIFQRELFDSVVLLLPTTRVIVGNRRIHTAVPLFVE